VDRSADEDCGMNMATIRQWHRYLGVFIAPSVLFFSLTGAVQLFSLHEAHGSYDPPAILEKLASVHKDQVFVLGNHHPHPAPKAEQQAAPASAEPDEDKTALSTTILKGFFLAVALCLALSTALGLWIALTQTRSTRTAWFLLAAGALIPLGLLLF